MINQKNQYGFDEIVDTGSRVIEVMKDFGQALKDGLQPMDALALWRQYPNIENILADRKIFAQQFKDLNAEESTAAYTLISERTGEPVLGIDKKVMQSLRLATRVHRIVEFVLDEGEGIIEDFKDLFAKAA